MTKNVQQFLNKHSLDTLSVDRLIVSTYLHGKDLQPSKFLNKYIIQENNKDHSKFQDFLKIAKFDDLESVIEAFEFVISPKEKVVTGAVYTPAPIREFIVDHALHKCKDIDDIRLADISCGCAGFLVTAAKIIKNKTKKSFKDIIEQNLWGLDIAPYSVERSKIILSLLAIDKNKGQEISFNISLGNALDFTWDHDPLIKKNKGFDIVVGNPPYVTSRNIDPASMKLLSNWEVTATGHPDLYIPFFQIGIKALCPNGILGYITVNTFFKSINGRALRKYFDENQFPLEIIDFRGEQVFKKKNTYTCICFIENKTDGKVRHATIASKDLGQFSIDRYSDHPYATLNVNDGWDLGTASVLATVRKIQRFKDKIFTDHSFSTGIATLKNSIYKFKPQGTEDHNYVMQDGDVLILIEKKACRSIINSNKVTTSDMIPSITEKVIFPYTWNAAIKKYELLKECVFEELYPNAYNYLLSKITILNKRDKGKAATEYEAWYAYGRNQGLHVEGIKLFLPHITNSPNFVISKDRKLMFCNGEAIVSADEQKLLVLKRILETPIFWFYIINTSKPYSSGYYSLSKNYIKNFSLPELSESDKKFLINEKDDQRVLAFLIKKYDISLEDIARAGSN